ncbi:hypothetical protein ADN00_06620 [Ornatilinea apprima]|uniref:Glycoside hydrolase family 1 protein n=1 Tax=Ornatilinea apprima TaxID=1134406 RepID=A0A0P6XPK2_9CHLR|nr:glycoside hydrolase family 1 protein [Ornatilinea apprima]KPL78589.1 hypothetical protein ADN00_06620 [Ornatilinea apprima]
MPQARFAFPKGFLWGCATAAHQVEGGNTNNNWYAWENEPGRIIHGHQSGKACDWWSGRWREDFDRAAETGQNAHRLSIEWSRVQPAPDRWDENAIDAYREMIRGLIQRKLTPMVTLHHFTDPLWLTEQGGWESEQAPELFAVYVRKIVEALKDLVSLWITINEPNVYTYGGYLNGGFPPGKNDMNLAFQVLFNLLKGHSLAYKIIHDLQPSALVGIAPNYRSFYPARAWLPLDAAAANLLHASYNDAFPRATRTGTLKFGFKSAELPAALGTMDFVGINYYTRDLVKFALKPAQMFNERFFPPDAALSETGFLANVPDGFREGLRWAEKFGLPIYITENGVEDSKDLLRPRYLVEHIHQVWRIANLNVPIKGYFQWSLVDNFEWERGWTQRFGLWGLDVDTQKRIRRPSVDLYEAICKQNAIHSDVVQRFAPQSFARLFPE